MLVLTTHLRPWLECEGRTMELTAIMATSLIEGDFPIGSIQRPVTANVSPGIVYVLW